MSFAVGLAYLALDRFRYTNRAKELLLNALDKVKNSMAKEVKSPAQVDIIKLKLTDKLEKCKDGLGVKLFFDKCPKMFGGNETGWDVRVTCIFLFFNFISLCAGSFLNTNDPYQGLYWFMFLMALGGIVLPVFFVYKGNKHINNINEFIEEEFKFVHLLKGSVDKLGDDVHNPPENPEPKPLNGESLN